MRIFSGICCILMLLFTVVQFNDPDVLHWALIYGVVAIWCGFAAFRPSLITQGWQRALLIICIAMAAAGVAWYFPKTPGFWHTDVWWVTETAREGMGMMIAFAALLVAWFSGRSTARKMI